MKWRKMLNKLFLILNGLRKIYRMWSDFQLKKNEYQTEFRVCKMLLLVRSILCLEIYMETNGCLCNYDACRCTIDRWSGPLLRVGLFTTLGHRPLESCFFLNVLSCSILIFGKYQPIYRSTWPSVVNYINLYGSLFCWILFSIHCLLPIETSPNFSPIEVNCTVEFTCITCTGVLRDQWNHVIDWRGMLIRVGWMKQR